MARVDINTGNTCMYFSDDLLNPITSFGNGVALDDFRLNASIFSAYRSIANSSDPKTDYLRVRLNRLFTEVQQQMTADMTDPATRDQLLALIEKKDYQTTLDALRVKPGIKQTYLEFYEEMVRQTNLLKSSLAPASNTTVVSGLAPTADPGTTGPTLMTVSLDDDFEL